MNPRVIKVIYLNNYKLELVFTNKLRKIFDMKPYIDLPIFRRLKDKDYFKKVKCDNGTIVWPHGQDICPDTLYLEGKLKYRSIKQ